MARQATVNHKRDELGNSVKNYTIAQPNDPTYVVGMRQRLGAILAGTEWNNELFKECQGLKVALTAYTPETLRGTPGKQSDPFNEAAANKIIKTLHSATRFTGAVNMDLKAGKVAILTIGFDAHMQPILDVKVADAPKPIDPVEAARRKAERETRKAQKLAQLVEAAIAAKRLAPVQPALNDDDDNAL